ncbi:MAG: hypothetical protein BGO70_16215 [Bacteroidetes bacterium 43-93]|nr:hypothetical protein [Bacteroidota bacterium]OJX01310.1 MAG: hypothetical protein BGO70_16215 [Bacteroidetes bacterium 43-93]
MKRFLLLLCAGLCITSTANAQIFPVKTIAKTGNDTNRINFAYLPDGFQSWRLGKFDTLTNGVYSYMMSISPFKEYAGFFNAYSVEVPSVDSGAVHLNIAIDCPPLSLFPIASPNTYFNSSFDNAGIHRLAYPKNSAAMSSVLLANIPAYDLTFTLINSNEYGGAGGGTDISATVNASSKEISVHETGHSLGDLQDEYWSGYGWEAPNMTKETDPTKVKWKNWIGTQNVGIYNYPSTAPASTVWYRPHQNCKMYQLGSPFCPVCKEALITSIYKRVTPIDSIYPLATSTVSIDNTTPVTFLFKPVYPNPNTLTFSWQLNGTAIGTADTMLSLSYTQLAGGTNKLIAFVTDTTALSRSNLPTKGYVFTIEWTVEKATSGGGTSVTNVNTSGKFTYRMYPVPAKDILYLECDNNTNASAVQYRIFSTIGTLVRQGTLMLGKGEQVIPIDIAGIAAGAYNYQLSGDGVYVNGKILVQ